MLLAFLVMTLIDTNSESELLATLSPLVGVHGSGMDKPSLSESRKADVGFSGDWLGGPVFTTLIKRYCCRCSARSQRTVNAWCNRFYPKGWLSFLQPCCGFRSKLIHAWVCGSTSGQPHAGRGQTQEDIKLEPQIGNVWRAADQFGGF